MTDYEIATFSLTLA